MKQEEPAFKLIDDLPGEKETVPWLMLGLLIHQFVAYIVCVIELVAVGAVVSTCDPHSQSADQGGVDLISLVGLGLAAAGALVGGVLVSELAEAAAAPAKWVWVLPAALFCLTFGQSVRLEGVRSAASEFFLGRTPGGSDPGLAMMLFTFPAGMLAFYSLGARISQGLARRQKLAISRAGVATKN